MTYYPYSAYSQPYSQIQIIPRVIASGPPQYNFNPVPNISGAILYNRNDNAGMNTFNKSSYNDPMINNNNIKINKDRNISTIFELPQINQNSTSVAHNDSLKVKPEINVQKNSELPKEPPKLIDPPVLYLFNVNLCTQRYQTVKTIPIPFDMRLSNNGRFDCLDDAMTFIGRHCHYHHNQFTKPLAKMYLPFCRVMSFELGKYIIPRNLKKIEFESAFAVAQKRISMDTLT